MQISIGSWGRGAGRLNRGDELVGLWTVWYRFEESVRTNFGQDIPKANPQNVIQRPLLFIPNSPQLMLCSFEFFYQ